MVCGAFGLLAGLVCGGFGLYVFGGLGGFCLSWFGQGSAGLSLARLVEEGVHLLLQGARGKAPKSSSSRARTSSAPISALVLLVSGAKWNLELSWSLELWCSLGLFWSCWSLELSWSLSLCLSFRSSRNRGKTREKERERERERDVVRLRSPKTQLDATLAILVRGGSPAPP